MKGVTLTFGLLIIAAYLLGSIPFGLLLAKAQGIDLRNIGSGNIGATNVGRALGKKWAYVCFVLDCLKGLLPMLLARLLVGSDATAGELALWLVVGSAAVIGHIFPAYLRFKGGKGVSTSLGMVLGLYPYFTIPGAIAFAVWVTFLLIWRYVSLASIAAATAFPAILVALIALNDGWQFGSLWPLLIAALLMPCLVVLRHVENIKRILEGSEAKISQK